MAVSVSSFKARYTQFATTDEDLVSSVIDEASAQCNSVVWGSLRDQGILLLTAHLLEIDAYGEASRLVDDTKKTTFLRQFNSLERIVTAGLRNA